MALRFTNFEDQRISAVGLFCTSNQGSSAVQVQLQRDRRGKPSGDILAGASLVPTAGAWAVFHLGSTPLNAGEVYHWVVQRDEDRGGNHGVGKDGWSKPVAFAATLPHLRKLPKDNHEDRQLACLSLTERKKWRTLDATPVFVAWSDRGAALGNPMARPWIAPVHGNATPDDSSDDHWQAQALHFHCGGRADTLKVRIRKRGKPTAPLMLSLFKHQYAMHKVQRLPEWPDVVVAQPADAADEWRWVEVALPADHAMSFSPDCHYFAFHSISGRGDGGGCADCWEIAGAEAPEGAQGIHDLSFDGGAHRSRAASSRGGAHWHDHFNRDLNVIVATPDCRATRKVFDEAVPTPVYRP